jgi:5'-nucleotidase
MNLLLTNDDGIDAPGLAALRAAVAELKPDRVVTVAPAGPMSECGHRVTTGEPIRFERRGEDLFAIHGSPADCARIALRGGILGDFKPDWLLSGINRGGNLGVDVYYSGTVAAAREARILGVRSMAISQYLRKDLELDWAVAARWTTSAVRELMQQDVDDGEFWNINLPHLAAGVSEPGRVHCERSRRPMPVRFASPKEDARCYAGVYAERESEPGADVEVCFGGAVAITKLEV